MQKKILSVPHTALETVIKSARRKFRTRLKCPSSLLYCLSSFSFSSSTDVPLPVEAVDEAGPRWRNS